MTEPSRAIVTQAELDRLLAAEKERDQLREALAAPPLTPEQCEACECGADAIQATNPSWSPDQHKANLLRQLARGRG